MKQSAAGVLVVVFCLTATLAVAGDQRSGAEAEVLARIGEYSNAISNKDIEACMAAFVPGDEAVMLGTGPGERWVGAEEIEMAHREFFKTFDKEVGESTWQQIRVQGDVAWGTSMSRMESFLSNMKTEYFLNNSFVLRKHKGEWRVVVFHFSNLTGPE